MATTNHPSHLFNNTLLLVSCLIGCLSVVLVDNCVACRRGLIDRRPGKWECARPLSVLSAKISSLSALQWHGAAYRLLWPVIPRGAALIYNVLTPLPLHHSAVPVENKRNWRKLFILSPKVIWKGGMEHKEDKSFNAWNKLDIWQTWKYILWVQ